MQTIDERNVFMVYGFQKNGLTDPQEIARRNVEDGSLMKCPVLAKDTQMALDLFCEKYPDLMVAGIVNLADMRKECVYLEKFLAESISAE